MTPDPLEDPSPAALANPCHCGEASAMVIKVHKIGDVSTQERAFACLRHVGEVAETLARKMPTA